MQVNPLIAAQLGMAMVLDSLPGGRLAPPRRRSSSLRGVVKPRFHFGHGYVQIAAKVVAFGKGLRSALWLAAPNEKFPSEVDILEHWASELYVKSMYLIADLADDNADTPDVHSVKGWKR